jgi:hypothetical protein
MAKKVLKFKDTTAGYGSALYNALEAGDKKLAAKLYNESNQGFEKYFGKDWVAPDPRELNSRVVVNGWGPLDSSVE